LFYKIDCETLAKYAENSRKLAESRYSIKNNTEKLAKFLTLIPFVKVFIFFLYICSPIF